jgi:adenosylmethionine-8-amino-7-oxononanoate aminotransferase
MTAPRTHQGPPLLWYQGQTQVALARAGGPLLLVKGEGSRVWDARGRAYLDARSGLWSVLVGYGRDEVIAAVDAQLRMLSFAPLTDVASPVAAELAARLGTLAPSDLASVALVPTGSEAVDTALKLARLFHYAGGERRRRIVVSREYSAHGSTYAGISLSDPDRGLLRGVGPGVRGIRFAPAPYRYRCAYCADAPACTLACAAALEDTIVAAGSGRVAAVFAEPVPGPGGVIVPPDTYWAAVRAVCDRHGVLLVADEVVTGFGRTGRWFACDHWGLVPDLLVLGKGMTGGYQSLAAVMMRAHVAHRLAGRMLPHGFTYSGHPAACAAALACLRIVEREALAERAERLGRRLLHDLRSALAGCPMVGEVRGLGLMAAVELVDDPDTRAPARLTARLLHGLDTALRARGVLCFVDNPLIVAPPLVASDDDVTLLVDVVSESLRALAGQRRTAWNT